MTYNTYHCAKCGCPTTDATALCRECEEIESMKNKIHNGDSVKLMEELMDNTIDLTVTSPPYDKLRDYNGYSFDFEGMANELFRVTKEGGVVVWVVSDSTINGSETGTSFKQALYFKELGFNLHDTMIYQKQTMSFPDKTRYFNCFEYMFVFSKGKPKSINLIRDRKNKWAGTLTHGTKRESNGELTRRKQYVMGEFGVRFNTWEYATGLNCSTKDKIAFKHPAIFPEKLAEDHIISWSNEGDIVLDPMCGSGTTCKMAKLNHRNYIGIDESEEYCNIARERLSSPNLKTKSEDEQ